MENYTDTELWSMLSNNYCATNCKHGCYVEQNKQCKHGRYSIFVDESQRLIREFLNGGKINVMA